MSKIAIIYFSKTDVTGQLARAIAAGVEQQGIKQQGECEILSHRIEGSEIIEGRFVNSHLMDELAECGCDYLWLSDLHGWSGCAV